MIQRVFLSLLILTLCGLCVLSLQSCNKKQSSPLAADPDINTIFTEKEIEDLTIILDFFEKQICDLTQTRSDSILDCYQAFFKNVSSAQATGIIYIPVPFHLQQEMYTRLSDAAFTDIWLKGTAVNQITGDTTERLTLSYEGKYMSFLSALRRDYQILNAYQRSFTEQRTVSSVMIETLLYNYHLLNLRDVRMRMFVALHYLTLNDMYERKNAG
jgi:hypothetical protein